MSRSVSKLVALAGVVGVGGLGTESEADTLDSKSETAQQYTAVAAAIVDVASADLYGEDAKGDAPDAQGEQ